MQHKHTPNPHNNYNLTTLSLLVSAAFIASSSVSAEEANTTNAEFERVVIVGEPTNTEVTPEQLEMQQANNLADVFRHIPSVQVGGSLGIAQKIYIRGLEDTLLNVTVDGAPQTGTLFHHIGRVSIEPELLERVEVQAGAGEATSGAGAIGGAIRFKTKNADSLLEPGETFGGLVKASAFTNDGHKTSASLFGKFNNNWGILASYVAVDRDNMEDGDGNELFGTSADQNLAFIKLNGAINSQHSVTLSFERRDESGNFGARPNWPTLEGDTLFPMEGERQTLVFNHTYQSGERVNLQTTLYHTESEIIQNRFDRWGKYRGVTRSVGFDIRNTSTFGAHNLTYGVDLRKDTVESEYLAPNDVWQDWAWDPNIGFFEEKGDVLGVYLQDHWQVNSRLLISAGVRFDDYQLDQETYHNSTDSSGVSPNLGLTYSITDVVTFNAGIAKALRGKEVGDAFTLEINPASQSLAPDLDAENVTNTEVGLEYNQDGLLARISAYQSDIDDVILDQLGGGVLYENIGTLETDGIEATIAYQWDNLFMQAAYSHADAKLNGNTVEGYEHNGLANARGNTFTLSLNYLLTDQLEFNWNYTHVQSLNNIEVLQRGVSLGWIDATQFVNKPGYNLHDIYLRWTALEAQNLFINFAIQNLFNTHYRDHASVADYGHIPGWQGVAGLYEAGRDIRLTLQYQF